MRRPPMAARHAVVVPALGRTRVHPGRAALPSTQGAQSQTGFYRNRQSTSIQRYRNAVTNSVWLPTLGYMDQHLASLKNYS